MSLKTNYKIGGTYYLEKFPGSRFTLIEILPTNIDYPLILVDQYQLTVRCTLNGKGLTSDCYPSLSISPHEFIAPKDEKKCCVYNTSYESFHTVYDNIIEIEYKTKLEDAIRFLKIEGYTITKQY